mgnify:CR=1 FL=1
MPLIEIVMEDLKRHEGFRKLPYKDSLGVLTVGYGRNLDNKGVSQLEAEYMLRNDVIETLEKLSALSFWESLNEDRQSVLVNMVVNIGFQGLMNFRKMIVALGAGDYKGAAIEMLDSLWASQVGKRATELSRLMRDGEQPTATNIATTLMEDAEG